jgi:hypothetical protein
MHWSIEKNYSDIQDLIKRYPGLYKAVYTVIEDLDPSQLAGIEDEYNLEVYDIIYNLKDCKTPADIRNMMIYVFDHWLGSGEKLKKHGPFEDRIWEIRNKISVF